MSVTFLPTSRARDRREFLPAALEVMETPASPVGRLIALTICAFFAIAIVWSIFGRVDIIATSPGKIVPTGRTKVIQPLEAGVVRAIRVEEGQAVKSDQVLVELDPTESAAERPVPERAVGGEALSADNFCPENPS